MTTIAEVQRLLAEAIDACNKLGAAAAHAVLDQNRETHTDDTLSRVAEGLRRGIPALNQQGITDLINGMHNEGILFRERTPDLTVTAAQADIENVRDKPWKPTGSDGAPTLAEAVGQALGSASMAWEHVDRAGVFDEAWCGKVYDGLMAFLADWGDKQRREANEATTAKASTEAVDLIAYAFHLRQHGERAPGGHETWAEFDRRAEGFLRRRPRRWWPAWTEVLHRPRRGSDVEAWLKGHRDRHVSSEGKFTAPWYAVDDLLDDYREHADHGTPLDRRPDGLPYGGDRK